MTDADISIRHAGPDDADAIHAMIVALARTTHEEDRIRSKPEDLRRSGFGSKPLFETVIAERAGEPMGLCLYFYSFSSWLGEAGIYIQDLYVSPEARGCGLGRRMLATVAANACVHRASHMRLSVSARNVAAKTFYDHIGMEYREQEQTYHLGGDAFVALAGDKQ